MLCKQIRKFTLNYKKNITQALMIYIMHKNGLSPALIFIEIY